MHLVMYLNCYNVVLVDIVLQCISSMRAHIRGHAALIPGGCELLSLLSQVVAGCRLKKCQLNALAAL